MPVMESSIGECRREKVQNTVDGILGISRNHRVIRLTAGMLAIESPELVEDTNG